jgi:uncharacterized protein YecE (DUF72 family)
MAMHPTLIGTCGWSYKDWSGVFYPKKLTAGQYLGFYAEHFGVVEVDSTFYHAPGLKTVEGWREKTPPGFGFSLKVPQSITHEKILLDCDQEVAGFLAAARILGDKLLCCVLQFGYFNRSKFADGTQFLERLRPFLERWPQDVPVAVEIRNKTWITGEFLDCLRARQASFVLTDQAWMPTPLSLMQQMDVITGPYGYIRLLGDRNEVDKLTETLDRTVVDRSEQIKHDARAIKLLQERVPVLVFVNNHFAGYAPETIQLLVEALRQE